ncbi:MAG: 2-C-methyl-D-erythritol 4-phosphate cytidylyltransferase [Lachnospiraceae bacterium]|nr:2-C-methyl-D-erythritol 4-phosphate cytidylyltransferase [Lachnospiraceae bacterium]
MNKKMIYTAVVLAAGKGKRMNSDVSKQFLELNGKPVLYYSLAAFEKSPVDRIILVTGEADIEYCRTEIVEKYGFRKVEQITAGGKERYHSVWNGIQAAGECDYILIHDGARAFIDQQTIKRCMEDVRTNKACVAAVPVKDTIKVVNDDLKGIKTPDRSTLWIIQTPQVFERSLIWNAYRQLAQELEKGTAPAVTDDTMVAEYYMNCSAHMVMGSYYNIKVTTPEDLVLGTAILNQPEQEL